MKDEEFLELLGKRIKEIRTDKNMKQIDLADYCDFEKSNMSRIEAGKANTTITTLRKICKALSIEPCELLNIDSNKN